MTFGFLFGSKNYCKLLPVSRESFCFARIRLDPWGGQVLHHDCISMIVSRFTTFTENFVICCNQITNFFCTRYGSANASSARGPCNVGPLADLAISVFWEVSINTMFTQIRTSLSSKIILEKNLRVSVLRNFIIHEILSEFLQPFRYAGMTRVSPFLIVVFVFHLVLDFWLA